MPTDKKRLFEIVKDAKKILITSHKNPDTDAICSCVGLYWILKSLKKESIDMILEDHDPYSDEFIQGINLIKHQKLQKSLLEKYDLIFFLDGAELHRFSNIQIELEPRQKIVRIDHHETKTDIKSTLDFTEEKIGSTSELIYNLFSETREFSQTIAQALLAGIYDDTLSFTTPEVSKRTFEIVADLVSKGANITEIKEYIFTYKDRILEAIKILINNQEFDEKFKYSYTYFPRDQYEQLQMQGTDMDKVKNFINEILLGKEGFNWAITVWPKGENKTKISFRSRSNGRNVRLIAESLGGGGHNFAAGATLDDIADPYEGLSIVRKKIREI